MDILIEKVVGHGALVIFFKKNQLHFCLGYLIRKYKIATLKTEIRQDSE